MSSILIVEDDDDVAEAEQCVLADAGYRPVRAANGQEALARLQTMERPCVVLLDLMMPVLDGWQFLKRLETAGFLPSLPVIVTTAGGAERPPGVRALMRKPYDLGIFLKTVGRYCPLGCA